MSQSQGSFQDQMISSLISHSDEIIRNKEQIDLVFRENTHNANRVVSRTGLVRALSRVTSRFAEEKPKQVARVILYCVAKYGALDYEDDLPKELVDVLLELNIKYEGELDRISRRELEGKEFFSSIESEIVVRNFSENIGFKHHFGIDYEKEVTIDTDIESSFRLVNHLLIQQKKAFEKFGEDAMSGWDSDQLMDIQSDLNDLIDTHNDIVSEESDKETHIEEEK